jgi:hypothetical protein
MNVHLAHLRYNGCDMRLIDGLQNRQFILTILSRKTSICKDIQLPEDASKNGGLLRLSNQTAK